MTENSFDASDDMFEDSSMDEGNMSPKQDIFFEEDHLSTQTNIKHTHDEKAVSDLKCCTPDSLVYNNTTSDEEQKDIRKELVTASQYNAETEEICEINSYPGLLTDCLKTNVSKNSDLIANNIGIVDGQTNTGTHSENTLTSQCSEPPKSTDGLNCRSIEQSVAISFDKALCKDLIDKPSTGTHSAPKQNESRGNLNYTLHDFHSGQSAAIEDLFVTCPFCGLSFSNLSFLESHIEVSHPEDSNVEMVDLNNTGPGHDRDSYDFLGVCPYCDQDLGNEMDVQVHITVAHEENSHHISTSIINCPLCDFVCSSEKDLKHHLKAHNTEATVYGVSSSHEMSSEMTCPVCGLSMTDPDLLISHVESHFNPKHSRDSDFSHSKVDTNIVPYKSSPKDIRAEETAGSKNNLTEKNLCHDSSDTSNVNHVNVNNLSSKDNIDPSSSRDNIEPSISKASFRASASKENSTYKRMYEQNLQKAVMRGQISVPEYHEQIRSMKQNDLKGVDDGSTRVSGLIQKLESVYRSQARPGQSAILCYPTDHYFASFGDKGWGCGYRNFQMILSCLSLLPDFAAKLFPDQQRHIPSIPKIQEMIESAWRRGFDPQGCLQLNGKLINTKKWIGATEIIATLSSLGIKCHLADFHTPSSHDGTHPRLLEWVSDHFRKCQSQGLCKAPLYLQHQGHSRTIIGVENDKGVTKLLLFDPGTPKDQLMDLAGGRLCWKDLRAFRRTQAGFRAKQYQIVAVVGLLSKHEFEESKILKSERVS